VVRRLTGGCADWAARGLGGARTGRRADWAVRDAARRCHPKQRRDDEDLVCRIRNPSTADDGILIVRHAEIYRPVLWI
jgi:hypothetical protein